MTAIEQSLLPRRSPALPVKERLRQRRHNLATPVKEQPPRLPQHRHNPAPPDNGETPVTGWKKRSTGVIVRRRSPAPEGDCLHFYFFAKGA